MEVPGDNTAPTALQVEGQSNPSHVPDSVPEFSAIHHNSAGYGATDYQIQVSASSTDWSNPAWDSGKTALATSTADNARSGEITYGGPLLTTETTYHWRIKFWDELDREGAWSTETASFSIGLSGSTDIIQNIHFTYDNVGNITQVNDYSSTQAAKVIAYTYDDLYRLTSASTTAASSTPFSRTYTYSSIGNITNKSDQGIYTYSETGYTNPHAATSIGGTNYMYDNNGNITSYGSDSYGWDYRNRLASTQGTATTTYAYDHNNMRVKKTVDETSTIYPNKLFNTKGATTTLHIFDEDGELLASIEGNGTATTAQYIHTDHLGGTNVVTDESKEVVQTLDYYPYGEERIETGIFDEVRKFTGHEYDEESDLTYAEQRYYDQDIGRWMSQDPVFLAVGTTELTELTRLALDQYLSDPQGFNSYSYARNNPLRLVDEEGEWFKDVITGQQSFGDFTIEVGQTAEVLYQSNPVWQSALDNPVETSAIVAVGGGAASYTGIAGVTAASFLKGAAALLNTIGILRTTEGALEYNAQRTNPNAFDQAQIESTRNQLIFDLVTNIAGKAGSAQEQSAIEFLNAALTGVSEASDSFGSSQSSSSDDDNE